MKLPNEELAAMVRLASSTHVTEPVHAQLEKKGLCVTGVSRFGAWTKITDAGLLLMTKNKGKA